MQKFRGSLESLTQNYSVCVCVCARACMCACVHVCVRALSRVQLLATSWTAARQAPLSLGFPRQEYWSGLPFPGRAVVKNPPDSAGVAGHVGSVPVSGRSSGAGNGNPLQYSCLGNPKDRGAWRATVHAVAKNQTGLK